MPPTRKGLLFHAGGVIIFLALGAWGIWHAAHVRVGAEFVLYFIPIALALFFVPFLAYRMYAMQTAMFILDRDSIRLLWGFRTETIAMDHVLSIVPASSRRDEIPLPLIRLPGAVLGRRKLPNGKYVEYFATTTNPLFYIDTVENTFAISPSDPDEFIRTYQMLTELGSLEPPKQQTVRPSFLVTRIWNTVPARVLILSSFLIGFALFVWVALTIPSRVQISLGFRSTGEPRAPIPGIRLMLFPLLNGFTFFVNLLIGAFLFREEEDRFFAYLLWGTSLVIGFLFLVALAFILRG